MENRRDFFSTASVVWNIIIINVLCLIATTVLRSKSGIELNDTLGLHFVLSEKFRVYQFFTYMFMHAGVDIIQYVCRVYVWAAVRDVLGRQEIFVLLPRRGAGSSYRTADGLVHRLLLHCKPYRRYACGNEPYID